jgi:hypothetical protein
MKLRHLRLASLIATFGLLAVVLTLWMKQPAESSELKTRSVQAQHVLCTTSANSFYLVEFKTKFSGVATGNTVFASAGNQFFQKNRTDLVTHKVVGDNSSPPLWLLNRSILI